MQSLLSHVLVVILVCFCAADAVTVSVKRVNQQQPMFKAPQFSSFDYSYNPAFVPSATKPGLLVRCQNWTGVGTGPSVLAFSAMQTPFDFNNLQFDRITDASIVVEPEGPADSFGTEDPRIVYHQAEDLYYLLYSAVSNDSQGVISRLALATSPTPSVASSWVKHGPLFPSLGWSKSGALLLRDGGKEQEQQQQGKKSKAQQGQQPHLLYFGDSGTVNGLQLGWSYDLQNWNMSADIWLPMRSDHFDSALVEAGPMPLKLSNGDYLFLYNSARHGVPSPKPGWDMQYNVGFVILNGTDPTQILQRSEQPIFSPELDWEVQGLTPNVVFAEGWFPLGSDTFLMFYGAADSYVGAAIVSVSF